MLISRLGVVIGSAAVSGVRPVRAMRAHSRMSVRTPGPPKEGLGRYPQAAVDPASGLVVAASGGPDHVDDLITPLSPPPRVRE